MDSSFRKLKQFEIVNMESIFNSNAKIWHLKIFLSNLKILDFFSLPVRTIRKMSKLKATSADGIWSDIIWELQQQLLDAQEQLLETQTVQLEHISSVVDTSVDKEMRSYIQVLSRTQYQFSQSKH